MGNKAIIGICVSTHNDALYLFKALHDKLFQKRIRMICDEHLFLIDGNNFRVRIFPEAKLCSSLPGYRFDYMYGFPNETSIKTRLKPYGRFSDSANIYEIIDAIERWPEISDGVCVDCIFNREGCERPDTHCYNCKPLTPNSYFKNKNSYTLLEWHHPTFALEEMLSLSISNTTKPKLRIKNVIFNDPATIVFWFDGTKTVVKCQEGETFDKEKGLAMAISKKVLASNKSGSNFNNIFKKWCEEN